MAFWADWCFGIVSLNIVYCYAAFNQIVDVKIFVESVSI